MSKSAKERLAERYQLKVAMSRRDQWEMAVREADAALAKSVAERRAHFERKYAGTKRALAKQQQQQQVDDEMDHDDDDDEEDESEDGDYHEGDDDAQSDNDQCGAHQRVRAILQF